jgi:myo-inositol-1(or 4)-monophosphatase
MHSSGVDRAAAWLGPTASETLRVVADAALVAGEGLLAAAKERRRLSITEKTAGDFVREAAQQAEETLAARLGRDFPCYGWMGEETGERAS